MVQQSEITMHVAVSYNVHVQVLIADRHVVSDIIQLIY